MGRSLSRRRQSGFSAIEALAALALVAVALIPLISLQSQVARSHARHRDLRIEATAIENAIALVREVNPMSAPRGALAIGENSTLTWRSVPIAPAVRTTRAGSGEGEFIVQLFRLDVETRDRNGRPTSAFSFEKLGWRALTPDDGRAMDSNRR